MNRPGLITFDCYGTLIDWNGGIVAAFSGEAERQRRDTDADAVLAAYHAAEPRVQAAAYRTYRDVLTELEAEVAVELGWEPPQMSGYLAQGLPTWKPFPETGRALHRLKQAGFALGILSNIDDDLLACTLQHLEVDFDLLVTAEQVRGYKPAPAHFERALEHLGGEHARMLHVAQSYFHDVGPACTLGIPTVWVNRLGEDAPAAGPAPLATVADLDEAAEWVEQTFSDG